MSQEQGRVRAGSVVVPLLMISIGVLFLLHTWIPGFYPWHVLRKFWPLIFIFIGAGMIYDRTRRGPDAQGNAAFPVGAAIGTLIFLFVIAVLVAKNHARPVPTFTIESNPTTYSDHHTHDTKVINLGAAKAAHFEIEMPAGELTIEGGADHLLQADFYHGGAWESPSVDYSVEDGIGQLRIGQEGGGHMMGHSDNRWKLKVSNSVPLQLKIDMGAGRGDIRLAKVDLTRIELNIGAGQVLMDLTGERAKDLHAEIQGGVGEAILKLPKNVGVIAEVHGGLGSIDVKGMKEEDGNYVNPAYGKSPSTIHLTVQGGIGHIMLQQE